MKKFFVFSLIIILIFVPMIIGMSIESKMFEDFLIILGLFAWMVIAYYWGEMIINLFGKPDDELLCKKYKTNRPFKNDKMVS